MMLLLKLWKPVLLVLVLAAAVCAGYWIKGTISSHSGGQSQPTQPTVSPTLGKATRKAAKDLSRPSFGQRVKTVALTPVSVTRSSDTIAPGDSSAPSRFGIVMGRKEGSSLYLSLSNPRTGQVEERKFHLPRRDSDFAFTADAVRANRDFGIKFGGALSLQVPLLSSDPASPLLRAHLFGPVYLRRASGPFEAQLGPYGEADTNGRREAGVELRAIF